MTGIDIWERVLQGFEAVKKWNDDVASAAVNPNNTSKPRIPKRDAFEDLELSEQKTFETQIKIEVWSKLVDHIERGNYTRAELAQILQVYQPDVSDLLRAKFSKFSTDKLIRYADNLNLHVDFRIFASEINPKEKNWNTHRSG